MHLIKILCLRQQLPATYVSRKCWCCSLPCLQYPNIRPAMSVQRAPSRLMCGHACMCAKNRPAQEAKGKPLPEQHWVRKTPLSCHRSKSWLGHPHPTATARHHSLVCRRREERVARGPACAQQTLSARVPELPRFHPAWGALLWQPTRTTLHRAPQAGHLHPECLHHDAPEPACVEAAQART